MRGANINAAATGLMQGIQYMDERNRRLKQDERQSRLDALNEQREARRAEVDGLTLQKTQMEVADYEADKPLREGERTQKLQGMEQDQKHAALIDRLAKVSVQDKMTGSLDGRIGMLNDISSDTGIQVKGWRSDPKTGKLVLTFTTADGKEQPGEYDNLEKLDEDILMLSSNTYRAKALQARQAGKAESEKLKLEHDRKVEIEKMKLDSGERNARTAADSRVAAADARAEGLSIMLGRGGAVPAEDAIKMQDSITRRLAVINKDRSLRKAPTEYKNALARHEAFPQYYGKPNPADYGFAQGTPAAAARPPAAESSTSDDPFKAGWK